MKQAAGELLDGRTDLGDGLGAAFHKRLDVLGVPRSPREENH